MFPEQKMKIFKKVTGNNPKGKNFPLDCPLDELAILKLIAANPTITQKELAKKIGKSERTIRNKVATLREKGYIRRLNRKRNGKWDILIDIF